MVLVASVNLQETHSTELYGSASHDVPTLRYTRRGFQKITNGRFWFEKMYVCAHPCMDCNGWNSRTFTHARKVDGLKYAVQHRYNCFAWYNSPLQLSKCRPPESSSLTSLTVSKSRILQVTGQLMLRRRVLSISTAVSGFLSKAAPMPPLTLKEMVKLMHLQNVNI